MISYQDFKRLLMDAGEFTTMAAYIADVGGSVPPSATDDQLIPLLTRCWDYAHNRDAATIRQLSGLSRAAFAREYNLPIRTLENWESNSASARSAPPYVLDLLAYAVLNDGYCGDGA